MAEQQELKEYRQGDTVHLTVELRDKHGVRSAATHAFLEGGDDQDPEEYMRLMGWPPEGEPEHTEIVLSGAVEYQKPGVYECVVIVPENSYGAMTRHELSPPLRFRIVEHPDDVREGPEVLSVSDFW